MPRFLDLPEMWDRNFLVGRSHRGQENPTVVPNRARGRGLGGALPRRWRDAVFDAVGLGPPKHPSSTVLRALSVLLTLLSSPSVVYFSPFL